MQISLTLNAKTGFNAFAVKPIVFSKTQAEFVDLSWYFSYFVQPALISFGQDNIAEINPCEITT